MSKLAVVKDKDSGQYKAIPKCQAEECTNSDQGHRKTYWHPGDDCLDPTARVKSIVDSTDSKWLQTYMDPIYLKDIKLENNSARMKSLKELSLQNLAISINETPEEFVEFFKDLSKEGCIPYLPFLTYPTMEKLVSLNAFEWMNLDGPFRNHCSEVEENTRRMFVFDRMNPMLDDPYFMMTSVFNAEHKLKKCEITKDTLLLHQECKEGMALASKLQFRKQFHYLTSGIFEGIDLSNLLIAGGIVLAALQPFDPNLDLNEQLIEKGYYNSDIDIFVFGFDDVGCATERVRKLCKDIEEKAGEKILFIRNRNCVTILREYPHRQIQVIFRLYKSPSEVLISFDIDCCCVGYDGKDVYGIPRFFASVSYQRNVVDVTRRSPCYEYRLYKYSKRGFGVLIPGITLKHDVLENMYNREREAILKGLPRLVALSKGSATRLYSRYDGLFSLADFSKITKEFATLEIQGQIDLTPANAKTRQLESKYIGYHEYIKFAKGEPFLCKEEQENTNRFPDIRTTELIDIDRYTESNSTVFSNYMVVKIPYSPNWSLDRIKKFIRSSNAAFRMTRHYGPFVDMPVSQRINPHRDEDEDYYYDLHPSVEVVDSATDVCQDTLSYLELEDLGWVLSEYKPNECWLIENPGDQLVTGSFEPVFSTMEEWINGSK
ncbi:hypothetical protein HDV06_003848 [Boothiomyces sp. JEL0866]|nr:hypothetical protein HDV06_003848 [Boothiomyces sp. JEL0866]